MTEWVTGIVNELGYGGIFLLLVLARVVPPVPAETVIPLAGMGAAMGSSNLAAVILAGGLGSAVGELFWYLPSRLMGRERFIAFLRRHGRWITVKPEQVEQASEWFARRGGIAVLLCQPLPGLRTLISIPAGACGLPLAPFFVYAAVGSCLQVGTLAMTGYLVRSGFPTLADYVVPAALVMAGAVLLAYVVRVVRHRHGA